MKYTGSSLLGKDFCNLTQYVGLLQSMLFNFQ